MWVVSTVRWIGPKDLAKLLIKKKITQAAPTHYEHDAKMRNLD